MKPNKTLLRKVAAKLRSLRHEKHYDQTAWARRTSCGTAACVAGHTVVLAGWKLLRPIGPKQEATSYGPCIKADKEADICETAAKLLRLLPESPLFDPFPEKSWPDTFGVRWRAVKEGISTERRSHIAADLLDAIAAGKVSL